jgi:hypothetical protein
MAYMDTTTNAAFIPTIIANKALGYFGSYMNLARTVATDADYTTATYGQVIQVPKRGALTANSKASNAAVVVQNPTATNISVTLNQHFEVTFGIDDVAAVVQNQNTQAGYAQDAALVLAEKIEAAVSALYASLSATAIVFDATSDTTADNSMRLIRKYFTDQKVPKNEQRHFYTGSSTYNALLGVQKFTQAQNLGLNNQNSQGPTSPIMTGNLLNIYNMDVFESQLAVSTGTTPSIVEHGIAYTRDAFILASRPLPQIPTGFGAVSEVVVDDNTGLGLRAIGSYNPQMTAMQLTLDVLFGVAVNDNRRAVPVTYTHA